MKFRKKRDRQLMSNGFRKQTSFDWTLTSFVIVTSKYNYLKFDLNLNLHLLFTKAFLKTEEKQKYEFWTFCNLQKWRKFNITISSCQEAASFKKDILWHRYFYVNKYIFIKPTA
jgi:hypothetical protein